MLNIHPKAVLALDLGEKRVGLAISHGVVAGSLGWLDYSKEDIFFEQLNKIIAEQTVGQIILGLPLAKNGADTKQSIWVRGEADKIAKKIKLSIGFVEESFSSHEASEMLGKVKEKGEIDAYSAVSILERFLKEGGSGS